LKNFKETVGVIKVTLTKPNITSTHKAARDAHELAARLPRLVLEARRISATVSVGLHGRRRAGQGENFWQYRSLAAGESATGIDWRRSARHADQLYVREREWEAAHSVFIFIDRSASMRFNSSLASASKEERAITLGLALADCLVKAGERVALLGLTRPFASHHIIDRFAEALLQSGDGTSLPRHFTIPARSELVLISDCLDDMTQMDAMLERVKACGAVGHIVRIIDPAEILFPFEGETELLGVEDQDHFLIGDAARFADRYHDAFSAHSAALASTAQANGASLITHHTDRPATQALEAVAAHLIERHPYSAAGVR
jgi:uncharacterized protein (DUF58 family)